MRRLILLPPARGHSSSSRPAPAARAPRLPRRPPRSAPAGGASAPAGGASAPASAAGGAAACATAPAGSTAAATVTIKDFKFSPQPVQAKVGDVVAWTNQDGSAPHSATMDTAAATRTRSTAASTRDAGLQRRRARTPTTARSTRRQMKDYTVVVQ